MYVLATLCTIFYLKLELLSPSTTIISPIATVEEVAN